MHRTSSHHADFAAADSSLYIYLFHVTNHPLTRSLLYHLSHKPCTSSGTMFSSPTPASGSRTLAANTLRNAGLIDRDAQMHDASDNPGGRKRSSRVRTHRVRKTEPSGASARPVRRSFLILLFTPLHCSIAILGTKTSIWQKAPLLQGNGHLL